MVYRRWHSRTPARNLLHRTHPSLFFFCVCVCVYFVRAVFLFSPTVGFFSGVVHVGFISRAAAQTTHRCTKAEAELSGLRKRVRRLSIRLRSAIPPSSRLTVLYDYLSLIGLRFGLYWI